MYKGTRRRCNILKGIRGRIFDFEGMGERRRNACETDTSEGLDYHRGFRRRDCVLRRQRYKLKGNVQKETGKYLHGTKRSERLLNEIITRLCK